MAAGHFLTSSAYILLLTQFHVLASAHFGICTLSIHSFSRNDGLRSPGVGELRVQCLTSLTCPLVGTRNFGIRQLRRFRFTKSRINYYNNSDASFNFEYLRLCGDISPNPGPLTKKNSNNCSVCKRVVARNHRATVCNSCCQLTHIKCGGITAKGYKQLQTREKYSWTCPTCLEYMFQQLPFADVSDSIIEQELVAIDHIHPQDSSSSRDTHIPNIHLPSKSNKKDCMIAHLNVNSLPNKFIEIKEWLGRGAFDIFCIQETKIDKTFPNSQFIVNGYNIFRRDRKKGGGGIMIFIRDSITAVCKKTTCKSVEALFLDITVGRTHFALIAAYKPPSVENALFTSDMYHLLDKATSLRDNIICLGDLNCDIGNPLDNNKQGRCLLDICDVYDLDSLINTPTRISTQRASCLDVILTNVPGYFKESGTFEAGLSDHCLVYTILNKKLPQPKAEIVKVRSFKNFNQDSFCDDLSRVPFSLAYLFDEPDDVYWAWEKLFVDVLNDHAPIKSFKRRHRDFQFITPEMREVMRERNRSKRQFNRSRKTDDWEKYRLLRNKAVSMKRKAVQDHFANLCKDKNSDQKKFWNTIKPYISSRKKQTSHNERIVLKDNGVIVREQKEVAEVLIEHFSSAKDADSSESQRPSIQRKIENNVDSSRSFTITNTNSDEVKSIMKNLKINKSTGHDQIPALAIKESAEILCHPFSSLVNYLFDAGKVPLSWKLGEIVPVHKKDCTLTKTNYRPITILPVLSKIFEKLVHTRIGSYFEEVYHKNVFAYRQHHGCDSAILSLTEEFKKELDSRKVIGLVSMDLSKAFDNLPHDLVVKKLEEYGGDLKVINLITNYLSDRHQRVKLSGNYSSLKAITKGVPQGSILGPLLFNIFMNDLAYVIDQSTLFSYADDTQIFKSAENIDDVEHSINIDLKSVDQWYENNQMKRNISKYQAITFGKPNRTPVFTCEDIAIPVKDELEILGVTLDSRLKFESQIRKICRKVSQQIAVLNRLKKILPFETRKSIYRAFIAPHFNYCSESWHHCCKRGQNKLEKINERAIRFVTRDKSTTYDTLLKQLNLLSPFNQRIVKMATNVYKVAHGYNIPKGIGELLKERSTTYKLRGSKVMELPKVNTTTYGLKSWRYTASKIWNALPDSVRVADNIRTFKNLISKIDLTKLSI